MVIEENKPLAPFTTFGIGGPARWFAEAASEDNTVECAAWARARALPLFVLGGGSNLLVADAGFDGLVLRVALRGIAVAEPARESDPRIYRVAAGENWDGFVERAVEDNCAGIECLAGIPGTTLISLLMRFYDVQRGAIRIDGVDIREMNLEELRSRFGVVLQDPFLFSGTVAGNIRLGTARIQDVDVEQAAEDVNLADFIRTLPGGFQEEVRERGSTLSTGQKQLISFARALAHNPKILILDEATSSVDTETEFRVRDALSRMVQGRTSLIIAHRLSTIQRADQIIVMHKGQVREMGTHQQLLGQRGIYYKLYQLQYKDQEIAAGESAAPQSVAAND